MPTASPHVVSPRSGAAGARLLDRLWMPIVGGELRGLRWHPMSGGKVLRHLLGSYERRQTALFAQHIGRGDVVFDIGAACGHYTLLSAKLVGPMGRVVAFEPDPANAGRLRQHVASNSVAQATVLELALGQNSGVAKFGGGSGSGTGALCDHGSHDVTVRRLDDVVAQLRSVPTHLKIDVEGAELQLLRGGELTLREHQPTIFLATHSAALQRDCCDLLQRWGYDLQPILAQDNESSRDTLCLSKKAAFSRAA